jgi:hypothetical protein
MRERGAKGSLVVRDGEGQVDAARAATVDDAAGGLENGWGWDKKKKTFLTVSKTAHVEKA